MTEEKKNRISELTRISRERALTPEALGAAIRLINDKRRALARVFEARKAERLALREEYLADWRRGTLETLENVYIIGEDGKEHKLPKKKF